MGKLRGLGAFAVLTTFVTLIAGRDVAYELLLHKSPPPVSFAFWLCATATVLSGAWIIAHHEVEQLFTKLRRRRVLYGALFLGAMCAVIYVTTFAVIDRVGAGLFSIVDWGLAPALTALIGILRDRDPVSRPRIAIAFGLYAAGGIALCINERQLWGPLVLVALLCPICTALSFPLQRWLMSDAGGELSRSQVTFVRFAPAALAILAYQYCAVGGAPRSTDLVKLIPVVVVLGVVPLILLCYALVMSSLSHFAVWQFAIPALTFLGTLHAHEANQAPLPIAGATAVLLGILVVELPARGSSVAPASGVEPGEPEVARGERAR